MAEILKKFWAFFTKCWALAITIVTAAFTIIPESAFNWTWSEKYAPWRNILTSRIIVLVGLVILVLIFRWLFIANMKKATIKGRNYRIDVEFEDIFNAKNCKIVIPFDECYSTDVGDRPAQIKPTSICGQYLTKYPVDDIQSLLSGVNPSRAKSAYQHKTKYDMGTIVPRDDFLLMAFVKLDRNGIGRITREDYLSCLDNLWREINKHYAQKDVCIPILGSGITRFNGEQLTQQELLDMMIISYRLSAEKIKKPYKLRIICKKSADFSLSRIGQSI